MKGILFSIECLAPGEVGGEGAEGTLFLKERPRHRILGAGKFNLREFAKTNHQQNKQIWIHNFDLDATKQ